MTIRRNTRETFDVDRTEIAERVREVLAQDPIYRDTVERDDGSLFETNVKPSFLFLDTGMHVVLERDDEAFSPKTVVSVTTVSQGRADPLGLSSGFINRFLRALRRRVEEPAGPATGRRRGPIRNRYDLVVLVTFLILFVALPAASVLAGFNAFAASVLFYPAGFGLGWALIRLVTRSRRRFGWPVAAPVAIVEFMSAFALLVAASIIVDDIFGLRVGASGGGGGGLGVGLLLGSMSRTGPEGRQGEVSEARDVRGLRGIRHWFFGPPVFSGNYVILGLMVLLSCPMLALVLFGIIHGSAHPVYFMLLAMGLGNIALGIAEALPLRPRGANAAMRIFFLLTVPVVLSAFVLAVRQGS